MNWFKKISEFDNQPIKADPKSIGYKEEWGEHHGPVDYVPDTWNFGPRGFHQPPMPLPKKLYHVTPFPNEITKEGFKTFRKPQDQTFGGHGTYVSFTSLENAKTYQEGLKDIVKIARGIYHKSDIPSLAQKWDISEKATKSIISDIDRWSREGTAWDERRYIAEFLKHSNILGSKFPLFVTSMDRLVKRLENVDPNNVAILEVQTSPQKWHTGIGMLEPNNMKGQYTFNEGENEWRLYDPSSIPNANIARIAQNKWYSSIKTSQSEIPLWKRHMEEYAPGVPFDENNQQPYFDARNKRKQWELEVAKAVSRGEISPQEAESLGNRGTYSNSPDSRKWKPLPQRLYHVTTNKSEVVKGFLKSRAELGQTNGKGLGGGDSYTISFTDNFSIAKQIYDALVDAQSVVSFKVTPQQMLNDATNGAGAKKPFINEIIKHYPGFNNKTYSIDNLPPSLKHVLEGIRVEQEYFPTPLEEFRQKHGTEWLPYGEKWPHGDDERYNFFYRPMTREEQITANFNLFKVFLFFREQAGGPLDPLFFLSDEHGLSQVDPKEIAILVCQPKQGALGYQVQALGEWRTYDGQSIDIIDVMQ